MTEITDLSIFEHVRPGNPQGDAPLQVSVPAIPEPVEIIDDPIPVVHIPPALRGIDLSKIETRTQFIRELTKNLPLNEYNLPLFIYRADLVDSGCVIDADLEELDLSSVNDMLNAASLTLSYEQGFPTIGKGEPLWSILPYESRDAFDAFLQYLEQPGARKISDIASIPLEVTSEWAIQNYWQIRARAYDLYKLAHHTRLREHRILKLNDSHYVEGERLFQQLIKALGDKLQDPEALSEMPVKDMISALDKVAKLQRAALGLSTAGAAKDTDQKMPQVEVIMREVSQQGKVEQREEDTDMTSLLQNPDLLQKAQEVIIKVGQ